MAAGADATAIGVVTHSGAAIVSRRARREGRRQQEMWKSLVPASGPLALMTIRARPLAFVACRRVATLSRSRRRHVDILENYPGLEEADVFACIACGAKISRERSVDLPAGLSA